MLGVKMSFSRSQGIFVVRPSNAVHLTDNQQATGQDAVSAAGAVKELGKRLTQLIEVKSKDENTEEMNRLKKALQELINCYQKIETHAESTQSMRLN